MSKPKTPKPVIPEGQQILRSLWDKGGGPAARGFSAILSPGSDDEYSALARQRLINSTRAGYGARGLAGSGISIQGEQDAVAGLEAQLTQQKMANIVGLTGALSGSAAHTPNPPPPRGFMGLK